VFVGTAAGELLALSASTGDVRWGYQTGGRIAAAPVVQDDTVYAVSTDYVVHAVVD
jgi:outer membrane protein assembly factor BamB